MNKYQEDFNGVIKSCNLSGRERIILNYGIEEGKSESTEKIKKVVEELELSAEGAKDSKDLCKYSAYKNAIEIITRNMK